MKEELSNEPGKYQICKMEVGSTQHFHAGLTDRIGDCAVRAACRFRSRFFTTLTSRIGVDENFTDDFTVTFTPTSPECGLLRNIPTAMRDVT